MMQSSLSGSSNNSLELNVINDSDRPNDWSNPERFAAQLRPMVDAIEKQWPNVRDLEERDLMRQAHQSLARLAELEEGKG
jgi:hypothetical protein